ncbi:hypothetical protein LOTGIDRAFT_210041 [Lottia gigantea]|uniref:Sodium-coupled monocarboxylate transporter 1 n=1 Tax=Lottia gigantea TaxID=225164 RepID=V3ZXH0_LOTGI|nr:hypothetical protein LOTGIDRAFT_210041 [Lottia gigantea]ESO89082.1 hypothetical protein LOTGIDRAFT_210041 [Lottia gigantea]
MDRDLSIYTGVTRKFGIVDYVMFGLLLAVSSCIGFFFAIRDRKRDSIENFVHGGKKMSIFPVSMSLIVTFLSALSLLGNPVEMYNYNTMFWYLCLAFVFAMVLSAWIFVPYFYNLGLMCIFEYLELRFSKSIRVLASVLYIFQTLIYMSFVLYAPSLALNAVTDFNLWGCIVGLMLVVTAYTALVRWTDTFQGLVIIAGLLAVLIQGSNVAGGFAQAWDIAQERGRILFDDFNPDPKIRHSFWSVSIGGGLFWMCLYSLNQAQIQRVMSLPTVTKAQISLIVNMIGLILICSVCFLIGIVMFAVYADCHPVAFKLIAKGDQLLPLFVMDILGKLPGIPGIFVSCVFSGSLSTLSSSLNALSAVTLEDFVKPFCFKKKKLSDLKITLLSKILVIIYGLAGLAFAFAVSRLGAILQATYSIYSILNGPLAGIFILGLFFPWANKWGAGAGCITSLTMMLWIGFGAYAKKIRTPLSPVSVEGCNWNLTTTMIPTTLYMNTTQTILNNTTPTPQMDAESSDPFYDMYKLSYLWYTGTGILIVVVVGLIVSFITGNMDFK